LSCAICEKRKEKRFCPAIHGRICPQCCGEQREVTLDCPSDCPYLLQAREQSAEDGQAFAAPDRESLFPEIEIEDHFLYEREELIMGLSFALAKSARGNRSIYDRDLIAALSALAKSYQTLVNSSLIYGASTANLAHQSIAGELEKMVKDYRELEARHVNDLRGRTPLRDSDVLRALVFLIRMAWGRTSGRPKSRGFIDFVLAQFPEKQSAIAGPGEASRIVIP
jgi:hypothetical protein